MTISVFTPTHNTRFLRETWESLQAQFHTGWEWVLVPNGEAVIPEEIARDPHVRIYPFPGTPKGVGELKAFACQHCLGAVLLELDHDDLLTPDCLGAVAAAFEDPAVQMVYSNTVEFKWPGGEPNTYSEWWGWKHRPYHWRGRDMVENIAWPPSPQALRRIYWSPNHLRAWRASAYHALGGHDPEHALVDDHDLNIRTYLMYGATGMRHLDKALYLYRVYPENTCRSNAREIRRLDQVCYEKYIVRMAQRWTLDARLLQLDLGGAIDPEPGFLSVDRRPGADVCCDLEGTWPFPDGSVGILRAKHIFEHLHDPIHTMNEAYRVLAPGGWLFLEVPSTDGRGAWQDPAHVSFWNENSLWYYTRQSHARYIPDFKGRFQVSELRTYFPSTWWEENRIPVVRAHLIALKPGYEERRAGEALI